MSIITFSKSVDFNNSIDSGLLHIEVDSSNISAILNNVNTSGDVVKLTFDATLTGEEQTTLNTIVSNHVPVISINYRNNLTAFTGKTIIKSSTYELFASYLYAGINSLRDSIKKIEILSYKDSSMASYNIQCVNSTNNQILFTSTNNTNDVMEIITITNINNVPTNAAILEFSAKRNGGNSDSKIYIHNIVLMY